MRLFRRFMPYAAFPGPASGVRPRAGRSRARERWQEAVTPAAVVDRFRRRTGLPELFLRDEITLDRDDVLAGSAGG